jgi:Domain of unknown function (DUF4157)
MSSLPPSRTTEREPQPAPGATPLPVRPATPFGQHAVLALQRAAGNRAVSQLLQTDTAAPPMLQRKSEAGGPNTTAPQTDTGAPTTGKPETQAPAPTLLVEDDAPQVQPGQMRKSEFLAQLRTATCEAADEALRGTIYSSMGCPYIERWFGYYAEQSSEHVERALHKYAPETGRARSARDYIPIVTRRVRQGVAQWAKTGEVSGVPPELAQGGMPGATFQGLASAALSGIGSAIGGAVSKVGSAIGGAISRVGSAIGGAMSSIGRALFKERTGGATEAANPQAIQAQLNGGQPLEASSRARMESAFGADFSGVRVHTDGNAAGLSDQLNARAFTVGSDIAFGAGEYQPGSLIGDALLAHELAHVVQQREGSTLAQTKGATDYGALEEDADVSAVGAIAATWEGAQGALKDIGRQAMPRLRSGLRLQGCKTTHYVTNLGANVETLSSGAPPMAPDVTEAQADTQLQQMGLLSKVTKLAAPTNRYDCHGFTFLGGDAWINDDQVDAILHDNGYSVTTTPSVGDIVIYRYGGAITHSGIIIAVAGTTVTKVRSKWGRLGLYEHAPNDVPPNYGTWQAYHTSRPGGHRLHQKP